MTRKAVTYTDQIAWLERRPSSVNGNPRFRIHFESGHIADTQSDSMLAYGIENPEYRDVPLKVTATPAGKVYALEVLEHPADCLYCAAGEGTMHNYEPPVLA